MTEQKDPLARIAFALQLTDRNTDAHNDAKAALAELRQRLVVDTDGHCPECHCLYFRTTGVAVAQDPDSWIRQCKGCGHEYAVRDALHLIPAQGADEPGTEPPDIDGRRLDRSLADFERACLVRIDEEARNPQCESRLVALLCDAVRLGREYADNMIPAPAVPQGAAAEPEDEKFEREIAPAVQRIGYDYALARKLNALRADVDPDDLGVLLGYVRSHPLATAFGTIAALRQSLASAEARGFQEGFETALPGHGGWKYHYDLWRSNRSEPAR